MASHSEKQVYILYIITLDRQTYNSQVSTSRDHGWGASCRIIIIIKELKKKKKKNQFLWE